MIQVLWFVAGVLAGLLPATWYAIALAHALSDRHYNRRLREESESFRRTMAGYKNLVQTLATRQARRTKS